MKLKEPTPVTDIWINLQLRYISFFVNGEEFAAFPLDREPLEIADQEIDTQWRKKRQVKAPQRPLSYYDEVLKGRTTKKGGEGV